MFTKPHDVSDWVRTPATFNIKKHGRKAIFSGDNSVVERQKPNLNLGGCVCYTSHPLPPGKVWEITTLATASLYGNGLTIGVTTTLPDSVPPIIYSSDAGHNEWFYENKSFYHKKKETKFPDLPSLNQLKTQQRVGIHISLNGDLHLFIDGRFMKTLATGLPVHQAIFGVVDVCYKFSKVKSEFLSAPPYTHHVLDDQFPGICFLGKPHEVTVESDPVTISPPGHGVSLKIPPNAIQSSDKPANVSIQTCLSSSAFQYPEGCTPLSAVYHISSDKAFDKDVELSFDHFAEVETDKQASEMTILRAEAQGEGKYIFVPMKGGDFKVRGHKCTISTRQFSFVSAGSISESEIRKRYTVLFSYSNEIEAIRRAAVSISLDDAVYLTSFRKALEEEWKVSLSHRCKLNVSFIEGSACVEFDPTNLKGWSVVSDTLPCTLSQEDVDYTNAPTLTHYDYPPRVIFDISPSENAKPSTLHFKVTGITKPIEFQIPLRKAQKDKTVNTQSSTNTQCPTYTTFSGKEKKPDLLTLMNLPTSEGDIKIIEKSAKYYRRVGTILLNDRYGEKVDVFEEDTGRESEKIILKIYKEWLAEDLKASWVTLTDCFRQCGAHRLAYSIEQHFGLTSPQQNPEECEPVSQDQISSPASVTNDSATEAVDVEEISVDTRDEITNVSSTEAVEELSVDTSDEVITGTVADLGSVSEIVQATPNEGMIGLLWSRKELVAIPIAAIIVFFLYKYWK